jgi:hypothetical protein
MGCLRVRLCFRWLLVVCCEYSVFFNLNLISVVSLLYHGVSLHI